MKSKHIFDTIGKLPEEISTESVVTDTGVDTENVRRMVFNEIHSGKKTKKPFRKRLTVTLVAATLGIAAVGTLTVGAMGGFNKAFGEFFAGEQSSAKLYSGGFVNINNSSDYNVKLLGVAGDEYNAYATLTIQNTDGSEFTAAPDTDYIRSYLSDYDPDNSDYISTAVEGEYTFNEYDSVSLKIPFITYLTSDRYYYHFDTGYTDFGGELYYGFTDNSTINCMALYRSTNEIEPLNLKGEEMKVEINDLYIYHEIEDICETTIVYPSPDEENQEIDFTQQDEADKKIREIRKNLKDDQAVVYRIKIGNDGKHLTMTTSYALANVTKLTVDMTGTWRLNYRDDTTIEIPNAEKTIVHNLRNKENETVSYDVKGIKASSFAVTVNIQAEEKAAEYDDSVWGGYNDLYAEISLSDPIITLENGEKIIGYFQSDTNSGSYYYETGGNFNIEFMYTINDQRVVINPEEIKSIELEGETITIG